ncbi:Uncharacterized protein TCM_038373 [Theobroma cacao]|uniref:Uncharacterized protein n=1 Tax=Theobroma cacao TaxID=3641 RepID=A0A061GNI0_THECC|nr:Uncharacterized protein TCM_038373 [Theobroma cacao]
MRWVQEALVRKEILAGGLNVALISVDEGEMVELLKNYKEVFVERFECLYPKEKPLQNSTKLYIANSNCISSQSRTPTLSCIHSHHKPKVTFSLHPQMHGSSTCLVSLQLTAISQYFPRWIETWNALKQ